MMSWKSYINKAKCEINNYHIVEIDHFVLRHDVDHLMKWYYFITVINSTTWLDIRLKCSHIFPRPKPIKNCAVPTWIWLSDAGCPLENADRWKLIMYYNITSDRLFYSTNLQNGMCLENLVKKTNNKRNCYRDEETR